jgi:twitching motility protein PilT
MIDHINANRSVNVVTIGDPIEIIHRQSGDDQPARVGVDTGNFAVALRGAIDGSRRHLVGEMRDAETVKAAWRPPRRPFVMSTLHTVDAQETVNRIIDFFPPHEQQQIRFALAGALKGILCQRLVPRAGGKGRVAAMEIAISTGRIADAITDANKTSTIMTLVSEGGYYGMQTFDQHLIVLFQQGAITLADAIATSTSPHDLLVEMRRLGLAN